MARADSATGGSVEHEAELMNRKQMKISVHKWKAASNSKILVQTACTSGDSTMQHPPNFYARHGVCKLQTIKIVSRVDHQLNDVGY